VDEACGEKLLMKIGKGCLLCVTCQLNFVDQLSKFDGVFCIKESLLVTRNQEESNHQLLSLLIVQRLPIEKWNDGIVLNNIVNFAFLSLKKAAHLCFVLSLLISVQARHGIPAIWKDAS
jgi:hypothetical protein